MNQVQWCSMETPMYYRLKISSNINMLLYLHHQWCDDAHILQSCSTNQYSKTVEYEAPTPSGYRVMVTKLLISGRNYCLLPVPRSEVSREFALTSQLPANWSSSILTRITSDFFSSKVMIWKFVGKLGSTADSARKQSKNILLKMLLVFCMIHSSPIWRARSDSRSHDWESVHWREIEPKLLNNHALDA